MRSLIEIIIATAVFLGIAATGMLLSAPAAVVSTVILVTVFQSLRKESWHELGLRFPNGIGSFFKGALFTVMVFIGVYAAAILAQFINREVLALPEPSLPEIANLATLIFFLVGAWISAAICEELLFRGFLMTRLADLFGRNVAGWIIALIVSSVVFGVAHAYQGLPGIILTGAVGFAMGVFYLLGSRNLLPLIIVHGLVDTISITVLYMINTGMIERP